MADKTPVRVVFNSSNVATGMAEFQSGETVPVANGGTGLGSIGSAGQVLRTNAAGNALEFATLEDLADIISVGSTLTAPSNADFNITTAGTGNIVLNDLTISDNTLSTNRSNDDLNINASGTGTVVLENLKIGSSGSTVTTILDEDNMSSNSATSLATQQSIKAYVDSEVSAVSTTSISTGDSNVTVVDSGTGNVTIEVDGTDRITTVAATTTTATGHSLVIGAGSTSTAGQIKFLEGTDNGTNGATLIGPAATADVTVTLPAATDTLVGKATTDTFTNKTIDANGTGNSITNLEVADLASGVLDTDITSVSGSDDTLASAKAIKTYVDAQVTASDLDFATDDSTALSIDLDSESLQVSGGANISTSGSANTITIALDTSLSGLSSVTSTALVTNNISSSDSTAVRIDDALNVDGALDVGAGFTISNTTSITSILDEDAMGSDSATALATQQSIKAYADTKAVLTGSTNNQITTVTGAHAFQGEANLTFDGSTLALTGAATITNTSTDDSLLITSTEDSNSAGPVITLKRNSSSPADADYLGRIKFKGENDADQEVQYGSISGKITDASDGTEDGAIEFNVKKAGANNIAVRLNSDELKLLNGTGIDVDGTSVLDGVTITDNTISTNESNSPLELKANGTGAVKVVSGGVTFTLPTTDGSDGDVLKTDGSGTLSFASSTATASDDTRAVVKNNKSVGSSARTIDYFQATSADAAFYFVALSDLTNDHSSASIFTVAHNNTDAFIGAPRGGASGSDNSLPSTTADISSAQVRVKVTAPSADSKLSYYKIPLSTANTSNATSGVTVTTANTDVDSASESIDTFAHASFRAAKYLILVDNDSKTETGVVEALVVHNGTNAFITQYGNVNSGNHDKIVLSAAISGSNVVVSAAGNEPNLSLKIHKTLLADSMTAVENANQKIIGATTVSSSATALDDFDLDDATAAVYYVVGGNSSEGAFSVQEVYCAGAPGEASVSQGPFVSTKGTSQLSFTAAFKSDADNSLQLSVASTSGGSTTVNAYRINCLAE